MGSLPEPGQPFAWVDIEGRPALVCRPLTSFAAHIFTTRQWPLGAGAARADDPEPWRHVESAIGVTSGCLARMRQVHGAMVVRARDAIEQVTEADILIGDDPTIALAV